VREADAEDRNEELRKWLDALRLGGVPVRQRALRVGGAAA
jgi:hypothetical protein